MPGLEKLVECPYNRCHRIQPHAMPKHLFKCRKNYPKVKLVTCPFNTAHQVPSLEIKLHTDTCADRKSFELYKYCLSTRQEYKEYREPEPELIYHDDDVPCKEPKGKTLLDDDECWDDFSLPAYNPQQYCKNANVIRKATLLKPSEKKEFYYQERARRKQFKKNTQNSKHIDDGLDHITGSLSKKFTIK